MKKYIAKLIFNINIDNGKDATRFDEQIRVIESGSMEEAFHKARSIGRKEEETFLDSDNKLVSWEFIDVAEVFPLEDTKDGDQLYSNTHKTTDAHSFIRFVRQKSMEIQAKNLTFA